MDAIGIYMPRWLTNSDASDRLFARELFKTIEKSGRYKPLALNLRTLRLASSEAAAKFCQDNRLVLIVHHDSPFYSSSPFHSSAIRYKNNLNQLEKYVPLVNSIAAQKIGHNKITTKNILRQEGLPALDDTIAYSLQDVKNHIKEGGQYVIKPPNNGAGTGVKLIKKQGSSYFAYSSGVWRKIVISEKKLKNGRSGITVRFNFDRKSLLLAIKKFHLDFTYSPMLIEPYFNDDAEGFSSLRCTVIGNEVVEAVKRTNRKNITSNISSGGTAQKVELSDDQKRIAVAAKNAVGADYAGVDFLVSGNKSVIGEVNIGPFTLFCKYTGVSVGDILAQYVMEKSDELKK